MKEEIKVIGKKCRLRQYHIKERIKYFKKVRSISVKRSLFVLMLLSMLNAASYAQLNNLNYNLINLERYISIDTRNGNNGVAKAFGKGSIAIGVNSKAYEEDVLSIGSYQDKLTRRIINVSDGKYGSDAVTVNQLNDKTNKLKYLSINDKIKKFHEGVPAISEEEGAIALGIDAKATKKYGNAIGTSALASGEFTNVFGTEAKAMANYSTAIGNGAFVSAEHSLAIGCSSKVTKVGNSECGVAIGCSAEVSGNYSVAIGSESVAKDDYEVSVGRDIPNGSYGIKRKITHVEDGEKDSDAATVGQIKNKANANADNIKVEKWSEKLGIGNIAKNDKNLVTGDTVYNALKNADFVENKNFNNKIIEIKNEVLENISKKYTPLTQEFNFYSGSIVTKEKEINHDKKWSMTPTDFNMAFGSGIKAENIKDKKGKNYTFVTLDKNWFSSSFLTLLNKEKIKERSAKDELNLGYVGSEDKSVKVTEIKEKEVNGKKVKGYDLSVDFSNITNKIDSIAATNASLAALHPLDYDPDNKLDFAIGYGNYKGTGAVAIGAYYRPNENTMISLGSSIGGVENIFNAGLSFKVGKGSSVEYVISKKAMLNRINKLTNENEEMKKIISDQEKRIEKLEKLILK